MKDAEQAKAVREDRNKRLTESDWTQLPVVMRTTPTVTFFDGADSGKCVAMTSQSSFSGSQVSPYGGGGISPSNIAVNLYGTSAYGVRCDYEAYAEL